MFSQLQFSSARKQPKLHLRFSTWARFHFFDRLQLWFNRAASGSSPAAHGHENIITLSESFYNEIDQHRIPVERQVVASLANAPGLLDFYIWIVWKSWTVRNEIARIPLFGCHGLQGQLGPGITRETSASVKLSGDG